MWPSNGLLNVNVEVRKMDSNFLSTFKENPNIDQLYWVLMSLFWRCKRFLQNVLKTIDFKTFRDWSSLSVDVMCLGKASKKLFHNAESLKSDQSSQPASCRNPLIVSQDQDLCILALMR
ncbi:hypothetical protein AVEN_77844-1 [Araneus ventricosus]|uniref:Uncharacterized protein n=1 Tax=Araneus ventricosus TaxID=182803 RepID=A0A4Y2GS21_ARAVE|nr:hypothetical protein AVEN_77844-1 [Araneus ventricosus]